jgi:hypothetical protein
MFKKILILVAGVAGGIALAKESKRVSNAYDAAKAVVKNNCKCGCNNKCETPATEAPTATVE